ncbi:hypothetical protein [Sporomusa acidovorans]|uniref:Uncharacterized protein n=1 Tax=Sporomusa acidovorans (strain ATCC 49682 / DSM 3132 / Mol) TaxID=1123286 RepID=A0ABZ3J2I8_SPOA4|nr:hypothetical protein [Sporomusa acidovorans]OZC20089.1 hypothetical protein SPACI_24870 [Sporomusa acidovorans DSM 3132]SDD45536.1 hypothetical protein SAMN04488499_1001302 [Sporomusa acidovorans]
MVLKLRISLGMAFIASCLTLLVSALNSITLSAMAYRTLVSLVLFAVFGYTCGQFAEQFLQKKLDEIKPEDTNVDIASSDDENGDETPAEKFEPLNPENLENMTLTQK